MNEILMYIIAWPISGILSQLAIRLVTKEDVYKDLNAWLLCALLGPITLLLWIYVTITN